ncbi:MAG: hypothetical protein ACYC8T_32930, partial [Myxococcaceae bacterium]
MSQTAEARRRIGELPSLRRAVERAPEPAAMAKLLIAAGEVLRRWESGAAEVDEALNGLPANAVNTWAASVDVLALRTDLLRAADEAVEAALPEAAAEGETWAEWAWQGLCARDRLESALAALARAAALGNTPAAACRETIAGALVPIDRELRPRARWLSKVNARRRAERDLLLPGHRERAWWFSARAGCDDLIALLAGELNGSPHLAACVECRHDLEVARAVEEPRGRHLNEDDLWRLDTGAANAAERAAAAAHAESCQDCATALRALREGEETIRDLTEEQPTSPAARSRRAERSAALPVVAARSRGGAGMRVVDDRSEFRVVLATRRGHQVLFV